MAKLEVNAPEQKAWMEIALSPGHLRQIVEADKLAVVIGVELDDIGNFVADRLTPTVKQYRSVLQDLHDHGVRYLFPVHVTDSLVAGAAIYESDFARANKFQNRKWWSISCTSGEGITNRIGGGWDLFQLFKLGDAGGDIPVPDCAEGMGHKNARGITIPFGRSAISEMMKMGFLIDIDHMSQRAVRDMLALANADAAFPYPLVSGHNVLRGGPQDGLHAENSRTIAEYEAIARSGGMAGLGFARSSAVAFLEEIGRISHSVRALPLALGSDTNGLVELPVSPECRGKSCVDYSLFPPASSGNKSWDYNEEGVAHFGLIPDFLKHVEGLPGGRSAIAKLYSGAEAFAQTWERVDIAAALARCEEPDCPCLNYPEVLAQIEACATSPDRKELECGVSRDGIDSYVYCTDSELDRSWASYAATRCRAVEGYIVTGPTLSSMARDLRQFPEQANQACARQFAAMNANVCAP